MKKLKNNLQIAKYLINLAKKAYKTCSKQKIQINDKGTHDLVTTLDTSIEKYMITNFLKVFKDTKIVSEEFNTNNLPTGTYFVVDPIDGTVNFANNIKGLWGVQCAYVVDDEIVAGAIYIPNRASFYAAKGFGAFKNNKKFIATQKDPLHSLVCLECNDLIIQSKIEKTIENDILKFRNFNASCVDMTLMAEGCFGGMVITDNHPWDILPGIIIMEEAKVLRKTIYDFNIFATTKPTLNLLEKAIEDCCDKNHKNSKITLKSSIFNKKQ